ncbi:hypothetical protein GNI_074300 [Gregarina niphandrodes]|uniref:Uncharacterized protein n=1 Tax=Gregarina niphandrodes TaxID=110365 RepID=A0A023B716_GRENI|nr:hypothetical protein GNI_074300 [Gregarina niphandrodes]EZG66904.1 hypothetical protein GNI_074300 [Gregarina niphandrodes]|eukprot:XP_011130437.1 hypothetical protein GNI_074300 [Gregarina niphandrodes]
MWSSESQITESQITESQITESQITESQITESQITESRVPEFQMAGSQVVGSQLVESQVVEPHVFESHPCAWKPGKSRCCGSSWTGHFWKQLEPEHYRALRAIFTSRSFFSEFSTEFHMAAVNCGFNHREWSLFEGRPVYLPMAGRLTRFGNEIWCPNRESETIPGSPKKSAAATRTRDFEAYRALHGSLSESEWKRMRSVDLPSFERCNLAYVELAATISLVFEAPYGTLDQAMLDNVATMLRHGRRNPKVPFWVSGCLLQHCGVTLERLVEFCVRDLKYRSAWTPERPCQFECMRTQAPPVEKYLTRPCTGLREKLFNRLAGLPTVSARVFGGMTKKTLDELLTAKPNGPVNPTTRALRWAIEYWRQLDKENYHLLSQFVGVTHVSQRRHWNKLVPRLTSLSRFEPRQWTYCQSSDKTSTPVYVPTLPVMTTMSKNLVRGQPGSTEVMFGGYRKIHSALSEAQWKTLRTVDAASFKKCRLDYVEFGAIISLFFDTPFGLVNEHIMESLTPMFDIANRYQHFQHWITGCLLQHTGVSTQDLAVFCVTQLKYNPRWVFGSHRLLECLKKTECRLPQYRDAKMLGPSESNVQQLVLDLLSKRLSGLPTVSLEEFAALDQATLDRKLAAETSWLSPWTSLQTFSETLLGTSPNTPPEATLGTPPGTSSETSSNTPSETPPPKTPSETCCLAADALAPVPVPAPVPAAVPSEVDIETEWAGLYWERLSASRFAALPKTPADTAPHRWVMRRVATARMVDRRWTLLYGSTYNLSRPLYIPTLGCPSRLTLKGGIFEDEFAAYCALHELLPREVWARFRGIAQPDLARCSGVYLALADALHVFFDAPFGLLDAAATEFPVWDTACLLQHTNAPVDRLFQFAMDLYTRAHVAGLPGTDWDARRAHLYKSLNDTRTFCAADLSFSQRAFQQDEPAEDLTGKRTQQKGPDLLADKTESKGANHETDKPSKRKRGRPRQEAPGMDEPRSRKGKKDATRLDATRLDATRPDATRLDATRLDATRLDATRLDATSQDPAVEEGLPMEEQVRSVWEEFAPIISQCMDILLQEDILAQQSQ